ncbi:MAG: transposase, partial [Pseudomonadota bacterium]
MFRKKDPQLSLFEVYYYLPEAKKRRLENSWPHVFRTEVMPMIPEEEFKHLYCEDNGRPNEPVSILVALSVIKEMDDLTDEQLLDSYYFDARYQYALSVTPEEAYLAPRTLYYFRERVVVGDKAVQKVFDTTTDKIIEILSLRLGKQRLDSTHIRSNMANLSRLQLFVRTIETFLKRLKATYPEKAETLPEEIHRRYLEREGYFADSKSSEARRRLNDCAKDLLYLVDIFSDDEAVKDLHSYKHLKRLFNEQCEVVRENGGEEKGNKVILKKEVASTSLQNPSDPDATYGRKGKGYKVQISETCDKDNDVQVITHVEVQGAHESDQNSSTPIIEELEDKGRKPDTLYEDAGYGSGENIVEAKVRGVKLMTPIEAGAKPKEGNLTLTDFAITDSGTQVIRCPEGKMPVRHRKGKDPHRINALFKKGVCNACKDLCRCPVSQHKGHNELSFTRKDLVVARRRVEQETLEFKEEYKIRSGVEATNSELKRKHVMDKVWTRGKERGTFAVFMKVTACNIQRFMRQRVKCLP